MTLKFFYFVLAVLVISSAVFGQDVLPIAGSDTVMVDSTTHFRIVGGYRSENNVAFYEPTTGNLLVTYYYIGTSGEPDGQRRIVAATSTDDGATWSVVRTVNSGVPDEMNAYYPVAYGNATTPIIVYYNRANPDANIYSDPILATDLLGWGGGLWNNVSVDVSGTADTVVDNRYHTFAIAPDNPNLWLIGGVQYYPNTSSAGWLSLYRSTDGGATWGKQIQVVTVVSDDSLKSNYVYSFSGSTPPLAISAGSNNKVYGVFQAKKESSLDIEQVMYATSDDGGLTWTDPTPIPGTETLWFSTDDIYRNFATLIDNAGNWHVFGMGIDTTEIVAGEDWPYRVWDFRFNGSDWTITKFGFPQLLNNGMVEPATTGSDEEDVMNSPAIGPDGTLYYAYTDVYDTTGSGGDPIAYKYRIYVMISQDNGTTWQGPTWVFDKPGWASEYPCEMTRTASDKLHFFFREGEGGTDVYKQLTYLSVPTQGVKDKILSLPDNIANELPRSFKLFQNYPNPFNPATTIRFDLKQNAHVKITIFNLLGQRIETIVDQTMTAGFKAVVWNAAHLPSGKYYYRLQADDFTDVKQMTLIK